MKNIKMKIKLYSVATAMIALTWVTFGWVVAVLLALLLVDIRWGETA